MSRYADDAAPVFVSDLHQGAVVRPAKQRRHRKLGLNKQRRYGRIAERCLKEYIDTIIRLSSTVVDVPPLRVNIDYPLSPFCRTLVHKPVQELTNTVNQRESTRAERT